MAGSAWLRAVTLALVLIAGAAPARAAEAEADGPWLFRVRLIEVRTPDSARTKPFHADSDISNTYMIDFSLSRFITPYLSLELTPGLSRYHAHARNTPFGDLDLGHIMVMTPTVMAQFRPLQFFHVGPWRWASPYIGVGVLYAHYYGDGSFGGAPLHYDDRFGPVFEVGGDFRFAPHWYANFEVKKVILDTELTGLNGVMRSKIDINPWVLGFGVGYRF